MKIKYMVLIGALGVMSLTGCTIKPMLIHETTTFMLPQGVTEQGVQKAIIKAAEGKGWQVVKVERGHVTLTYPSMSNPRSQTINAVVRVDYTDKNYRIVHVSDRGLEKGKCNGVTDEMCIHRNYNRWVANLDLQIGNQIYRMGR